MSTPEKWSHAFALQAKADLDAREVILHAKTLPECQQLHFLQMACEKLCKAHLFTSGQNVASFQSSHAYVAKVLPVIIRSMITDPKSQGWLVEKVRHLAREIELLAPAVDNNGARPDNCEYPWEDAKGAIHAPSQSTFPNLNMLYTPGGRAILKLITAKVDDLIKAGRTEIDT